MEVLDFIELNARQYRGRDTRRKRLKEDAIAFFQECEAYVTTQGLKGAEEIPECAWGAYMLDWADNAQEWMELKPPVEDGFHCRLDVFPRLPEPKEYINYRRRRRKTSAWEEKVYAVCMQLMYRVYPQLTKLLMMTEHLPPEYKDALEEAIKGIQSYTDLSMQLRENVLYRRNERYQFYFTLCYIFEMNAGLQLCQEVQLNCTLGSSANIGSIVEEHLYEIAEWEWKRTPAQVCMDVLACLNTGGRVQMGFDGEYVGTFCTSNASLTKARREYVTRVLIQCAQATTEFRCGLFFIETLTAIPEVLGYDSVKDVQHAVDVQAQRYQVYKKVEEKAREVHFDSMNPMFLLYFLQAFIQTYFQALGPEMVSGCVEVLEVIKSYRKAVVGLKMTR